MVRRLPLPRLRHQPRAVVKVHGRGISWGSWCPEHPKEALRPILAGLMPQCVTRHRGASGPRPGDLTALALSGLHETALKVALLELDGMTRTEAMDKLSLSRAQRYRIPHQLSHRGDKSPGR